MGNNKEPTKPNKAEMAAMGCDEGMCAGCELYGWRSMLGEWQPLDGWCNCGMRSVPVRADEKRCQYFVKRGDA